MSPTIRIDDEVYAWLQGNARAFEDTPNSVLRRLADLDQAKRNRNFSASAKSKQSLRANSMIQISRPTTGQQLNEEWKVGARHALYHREGHWYENLERFPGALFDANGYIVFKTEEEYRRCPYLRIGIKVNVPKRISSIPGYVRKR